VKHLIGNINLKDMSKTKQKISSKGKKSRKGLGWSEAGRNANTLKRVEKAYQEEKEAMKIVGSAMRSGLSMWKAEGIV
jgi:hypothetical protein